MKPYRLGVVIMIVVFAGVFVRAVGADTVRDAKVVITAPSDPTCPPDICFSGNTITVDGTTDSQTNFLYTGSIPLDLLIVDVTPTLPNDTIFCILFGTAFNECGVSSASTPPPPGLTILDLICDTTVSPCTGLVSGQGVGVSVSVPEPTEKLQLGIGLLFVGLIATWKTRRAPEVGQGHHRTLVQA
jgi:hypothetical protein